MFKERLHGFKINHHYCEKYITFVMNCKEHNEQNQTERTYMEKHHVLPKYIFPEHRLDKWNIIPLTPRQHYIAHLILSKVFLGREQYGAALAMNRMNKKFKKSRHYEANKLIISNYMKNNNPMFNPDIVKKATEQAKKFFSTPEKLEMRKRMSESRIGVPSVSEEGKRKLSEMWMGVKKPPRKQEHTDNQIKSLSRGKYHTPFGDFDSPNQTVRCPQNPNLSRMLIDKYCKNNINGFSFTPNGKPPLTLGRPKSK